MTLRALIQRLAQQELDWQGCHLLAPVVAPGRARVRLQGLVYQLSIVPPDYRGFGVFRLSAPGMAEFVRSATPPERENYLRLWPRRQLRLLRDYGSGCWMTLMGPVYEVERGSLFELVEAAFDGRNYWYCRPVLNTRLRLAEEMAQALAERIPTAELRLKGMTPEDRSGYDLCAGRVVSEPRVGVVAELDDQARLTRALARGGGRLRSFSADNGLFQVSWQDSQGRSHHSTIRRDDLTVMSSGICLSGRDSDFDLTSLVGVMEEDEEL
ncbi:hypothetical protein JST97_09005 [bacterium]|nr:hypothetical protein [bacterium]